MKVTFFFTSTKVGFQLPNIGYVRSFKKAKGMKKKEKKKLFIAFRGKAKIQVTPKVIFLFLKVVSFINWYWACLMESSVFTDPSSQSCRMKNTTFGFEPLTTKDAQKLHQGTKKNMPLFSFYSTQFIKFLIFFLCLRRKIVFFLLKWKFWPNFVNSVQTNGGKYLEIMEQRWTSLRFSSTKN